MRLVGIHEDLSFYEGAGDGPDIAKIKAVLDRPGGPEADVSDRRSGRAEGR
jgi:hypothetical protein